MAFVVGDHVWFKAAGSTPFVRGDASDPGKPVSGGPDDPNSLDFGGSSLGGRGLPEVSLKTAAQSGLSDAQGVPTIKFSDFPNAKDSQDTVDGGADKTFPASGEHIGVRDQITDNNPLAPGHVSTDGVFDDPTPKRLIGLGTEESGADEGDVTASHDTIRDIDPNQIGGRTTTALAGGASTPSGNANEFASHVIDVAGSTVGNRLPSSEEGPGVVIQVVVVKHAGKSPDGTVVTVGSKLYWVNWGSSAVSNPHRTKSNNRMRATLHAQADLIAA